MNFESSTITKPPKRRLTFGLRGMLLLIALIAVGLAMWEFRKEQAKPNLEITFEDVLWLTGYQIWKLDLSKQGPIYGFQIVVEEENELGGSTKQPIVTIHGHELINTKFYPVLTVAMNHENNNIQGKWKFAGVYGNFKARFPGNEFNLSWVNPVGFNDDATYYIANNRLEVQHAGTKTGVALRSIGIKILSEPKGN